MQNLDGMDRSDLHDAATAFAELCLYAITKARAMECRADGNIDEALAHERQCERLYRGLPAWARW